MPGVYLLYTDEQGNGQMDRLPGERANYKLYGSERLAGGVEALINQYANNKAIPVPGAIEVDGLSVKLSVCRTHVVLSALIPGLQMNTKFILRDGKLLPKFDGASDAVAASLFWKPPANMKLYFAVRAEYNKNLDKHYWAINPYLWAMCDGMPNYWRLPLPNNYDDSRLCLDGSGDTFSEFHHTKLPAFWKLCYDRFVYSSWNADLLSNKLALAQAMFQFSPLENSPSLECPGDWTKWCKICSNAIHEEALAV